MSRYGRFSSGKGSLFTESFYSMEGIDDDGDDPRNFAIAVSPPSSRRPSVASPMSSIQENTRLQSSPIVTALDVDRSAPWYRDAKKQGFSSGDINEFFGAVEREPAAVSITQKLSPYQEEKEEEDMVQNFSRVYVNENTAFDREEFEICRIPSSRNNNNNNHNHSTRPNPFKRDPDLSMELEAPSLPHRVKSPLRYQQDSAFQEEDVLEQYRILAQHDAMARVKQDTGFDPEEYEKRRKLQPPERSSNSNGYSGGKRTRPRLPPMRKITPLNITLKMEEPPMPPPRVNNYFLQQVGLRTPNLCTGVTVGSSNGSVSVNKDEHLVLCLGCQNQLRVSLLATLVSCPDCNTVSPLASTR